MVQKVLIGLAALVLLVLLGLIVAPRFIDWNGYKGEIAAQVRELTGRDLSIDGDISLSILPSPTLSAYNVRLANIEGGSGPEMLSLDALEAHVALMPLLQRRVQVERVTLVQPTILLERLPDGRRNWTFEPVADSTAGSQGAGRSPEFQLDNLTIEGGTLLYRGSGGGEQQFTGVDARISAQSLSGPFRADGVAQLHDVAIRFEVTTGKFAEGARAPVGLTIHLPVADGKLSFSGGILLEAEGATTSGKLAGSLASLADLLALVGAGDTQGQPTVLNQPFKVAAEISGAPTMWQLDDLTLELGDMLAKGDATADLSAVPRMQVKLALNRFDLDRFLEPSHAPDGAADGGGAASPLLVALPEGIAAQLDLAVEALTYRGSIVSKARLLAGLADGQLAISRLSALLPGGSDATLAGRLTAEAGQPRFDGTLEGGSDNLRAVLDWLDLSPLGIPRDRLRKGSLTTRIAATPAAIEFSDFNLRLDQSQIAGGIIVALPQAGVRSATAYGVGLVVDQLNFDAYLPAPRSAGDAAGDAPTAAGLPVHMLAPLADIDANIELRIGSSTYRTHPIEGVHVDATLHTGNLTLRDLSARGLAGGSARLSGSVEALAGATRFDLAFEIDGADAGRAAQMAGASGQPPSGLGELTLEGTLAGGADDLAYDLSFAMPGIGAEGHAAGKAAGFMQGFPRIDADLRLRGGDAGPLLALAGLQTPDTAGLGAVSIEGTAATGANDITYDLSIALAGAEAEGTLKGTLAGLPGLPRIDVQAALRARKPQPLLAIAGLHLTGGERMGEASLAGSVSGPVDDLQIDLRLGALGGQATAKGSLQAMAPPFGFDLALAADHPELRELLAAFGLRGGRPGALGAFAFAAAVKGSLDAASAEGLTIEAGSGRIAGDLRADMTGSRPAVTAALSGRDLDLTVLLGAGRASAGGGGEGGGGGAPARRSREAIDFTPLRAVDAEIDLVADAATLDDIRFEQLQTRFVLREGTLTLEKFIGEAFGGSLDLTGRLATRGVPSAEARLRASQVAIEQLIRGGGLAGQMKGPVTISADLRTSGSSIAALIEGLAGSGTFDGTLTPLSAVRQQTGSAVLDLLGAQVKQVRGLTDVVAEALAPFAGRASGLSGSFQVREGVFNTRDTALQNPQARALSRGSANLSAWTVDTTTDVFRAQDSIAPYVTVRLKGSLEAPNISLSGSAFSGRRGDSSSSGQPPDQTLPPAAPGSSGIGPAADTRAAMLPEAPGGFRDMLEQVPQ